MESDDEVQLNLLTLNGNDGCDDDDDDIPPPASIAPGKGIRWFISNVINRYFGTFGSASNGTIRSVRWLPARRDDSIRTCNALAEFGGNKKK
uniref:Uncharacterized protein n=1 Tax=Anopheles minimus TaxID=112268 RepID=A0A182W9M5_9DIPT